MGDSDDSVVQLVVELVRVAAAAPTGSAGSTDDLIEVLREPLDATSVLLHRIDLGTGDSDLVGADTTGRRDGLLRRYARELAWQNPLVAASARGELQPTTAQRLVGRRAWRSGPAYRAVRESHGVDQVASLPLGGSPEGVAAVVVARPGNDFTDAQVSILRRAQPVVVGLDRMLHRVASQPSTAPEPPADRPVLTNRQSEVLVLLARGLTAAAMARAMGCAERTVHRHLSGIYSELGVHDRLLAVQRATEWQLLPP